MTQFEFSAKPPYPVNEQDEYSMMGVCYLIIEDTSRKINFREDEGLFFEVKYEPSGKSMGSIRTYINTVYKMNPHIFNYVVQYDCPFKITITCNKDRDLSGLTARLIPIKENEYTTKV